MGEKAIRSTIIDNEMDTIISSLCLEPSWKEKIITKISTLSEHDRILNERKHLEDRLRRLAKASVDGLFEEKEYELQHKLMKENLATLIVPEIKAALDAGELIDNLGSIWAGATLEEKHKILTLMLDAIYVDLLSTRSIVGLLPKPAFYGPFESLKQIPDSKVIIFNPERKRKCPDKFRARGGYGGDGGGLKSHL